MRLFLQMFELEQLRGSPGKSIALQTKTGRDIANERGLELSEQHRQRFAYMLEKYAKWQERCPPDGGYNCAGHVWASRRTCIYEEHDWQLILNEDGYHETASPIPGDLVIYVDATNGILHIGRIMEMRPGVGDASSQIPWVVSKWGDTTGEVYHWCYDHHFVDAGFNVTCQFWTDRQKS
jgi:hypothetical protein